MCGQVFPLCMSLYKLVPEVIEALIRFQTVLAQRDRFNRISVAQFASRMTPTTHVYMDASETGLCVLEPHQRQFITVQYSRYEIQKLQRGMTAQSINIREPFTAQYSLRSTGVHRGNSNDQCAQYTYGSTLTI
ncbi:hypothetical protein PHMEG_0008223 [Phytophthora megakarya]|uniref:Uncharacterized protein n=1 Tax=Phytophthora megakarya TaxID=4795 RepID=A0A225WLC2_9STRA|nr:hypothetical protein PHMEG_0008223 [Phytophthora megakarya]